MAAPPLTQAAAFAGLGGAGSPLVLGYWAIRGLAQPVRTLLAFTATPFVEVLYGDGAAEEARWAADKLAQPALGFAFPNLPYIASGAAGSPGAVRLTQSTALLEHVARANPSLQLLGATPAEADLCSMFLMQVVDARGAVSGYTYGSEPALPAFLAGGASLAPFEAALGERAFCAGAAPTIADFALVEMVLHVRAILAAKGGVPDVLGSFPRLRALVERFRALPGVSAALESAERMPWNGDTAQFR
jgi:glutathione S-transferase